MDDTEDLTVTLMREEDVRTLLENDRIYQSLMVAPLYKYFYTKK